MEHLQTAHDAILSKIGAVKRLSMKAIKNGQGKSETMLNLAHRARDQLSALEGDKMKQVEKLLYKQAHELADSDVKPVLVEAAKALQSVIMLEKGAQSCDEYQQQNHGLALLGVSGRDRCMQQPAWTLETKSEKSPRG